MTAQRNSLLNLTDQPYQAPIRFAAVMHDAQCGRSMSRAVGSRSLKASMPLAEILLVRRTALASGHAATRSSRTSIWAAINCAGPATVREARRRASEPSGNPVQRLSGDAPATTRTMASSRPLRGARSSGCKSRQAIAVPRPSRAPGVRRAGRHRPSGFRRSARSGGRRPAAGIAGCRPGAASGSNGPEQAVA